VTILLFSYLHTLSGADSWWEWQLVTAIHDERMWFSEFLWVTPSMSWPKSCLWVTFWFAHTWHHGYTLINFCVVFLSTISWELTCSSSFIYMLTWRVQPAFFEPDLEMEFVTFYLLSCCTGWKERHCWSTRAGMLKMVTYLLCFDWNQESLKVGSLVPLCSLSLFV
jgi:hypothetical protein